MLATNFQIAPSNSVMPKFFSDRQEAFSETQAVRIVEMFRRALGRELTLDERKYVGESGNAFTVDAVEGRKPTQNNDDQVRASTPRPVRVPVPAGPHPTFLPPMCFSSGVF